MTAVGSSGALPAWRRMMMRRRWRVGLAVVLLAIVVRIALPAVVRRVVVAQADQAMVGRIELDDVDLSLATAGFTLHGLRVFSTEAPAAPAPGAPAPAVSDADESSAPRAGEGPPGSAPVFSAARLTVDLGVLALFRKIVEIRRIELADVAVSLDRAKDGALVLPAAIPAAEPAPVADGPGWGVLIQSVALRNGRIGFRDF